MNVKVRQRPDRKFLQLAYTDPVTGSVKTKSAKTTDWKKAERAAATWEAEIAAGNGTGSVSWSDFRERFELEHIQNKSKNSQQNYKLSLDRFEELIGNPRDIKHINASLVSKYATKLRAKYDKQSTVATHLMVLRVALNWAASIGLIAVAPKIKVPAIETRGGPITIGQFIGFLRRVQQTSEPEPMTRLLMVMYFGGLRISEALKLSVDSGPVQVDFSGRRPAIAWLKGGQKSGRVERSPIAPDFARYLARFKSGSVVGTKLAFQTIKNRLNLVGNGITAHDLRKTFGTRWALKVHPITLKAMMRHRTIETTLKYYVDLEADKVADQLWESVHANVHEHRFETAKSNKAQGKNARKN